MWHVATKDPLQSWECQTSIPRHHGTTRRRVVADVALKLTRPFNSIPYYHRCDRGNYTLYHALPTKGSAPYVAVVPILPRSLFRITLFREQRIRQSAHLQYFSRLDLEGFYTNSWHYGKIQNPVWENPATASFQRAKIRHSTSTGAREQRGARLRRRRVIPHNHRLRRRRRRRVRVVRHVDERSSEN